ncbi:MAG: asparagine synthase B [Parasporobacterium sp.]|nr:asparagine synthase B [Parasporobacterium sp.]
MCTIMSYCGKTAAYKAIKDGLSETKSRGPDDERIIDTGAGMLGFQRLSIMGLTPEGMQPFELDGCSVVCNGELYGFEKLRKELLAKGYSFASDSDCEVLLPLYLEHGCELFQMLDAEFACVIFDGRSKEYIAARDPIGIRPLYFGFDSMGTVVFASEAKNLTRICKRIMPFPPGYYCRIPSGTPGGALNEDLPPLDMLEHVGQLVCYRDITSVEKFCADDLETVCGKIHDKLTEGVRKRLVSDSRVGFLLSGGLDSSLVCAIAAKECPHPIHTFAIGMSEDAIDLKYARQVADFIGSDHTEVYMTPDEVISSLEEVIKLLGTFDITTIRASMGMYLVCKAIHETTDIRVLLTGEISDELFGYKYTDFAPSAEEFQKESEKRIRELHMYDVLRADRCISVNSLEARVPFGDLDFAEYVMSINPEMKRNIYGKGKYLLRHAFEADHLLPEEILMREKAAFSDAVGHSMVDYLKEYAEGCYTDSEFKEGCLRYDHARPFTKESLLYRDIFEKYYPGQSEMIIDFWMPNKEWEGCNVDDPSARVLSNYGDSGK